jgi:metal-responsive CopG/Arc/MetJ family transcriptional regulator
MKLSFIKKLQYFENLVDSLRLGTVKSDRRIQVKMPSQIVQELDNQFPDSNRSQILTQLAADLISQKLKFQDREILTHMQNSEQSELDEMWNYLEERDVS